jgi:drug/metabolite transporter (DMT)-like permease
MRLSDLAELLLLAALWGGSFLFLRMAAPALGPIWLIEIRVLLAGLALLPLLLRSLSREHRWQAIAHHALPLLIVGCISSALPFVLLAFASLSLPAGFTSILNATTPLFGTIVAAIWFGERLTLNSMAGFVLGFSGVLVLVGWKSFALTPSFLLAVAAGLSAALMYAIAAPYAKKNLSTLSPTESATMTLLCAALVLSPATPFTRPTAIPAPHILLAVLLLALFSTSLAYVMYFRLLQKIGPTKSLTVTYLIPAFAMLWGALFLKEPITLPMVFGCALVLLGTATANDLFKTLRSDA